MIETLILQASYFGSIAQYAAILQSMRIEFESCDHFLKQTYRTRMYICAANGKLDLNVPINSIDKVKKLTKDVKINYAKDWQKTHFRSIQSAYSRSPFFEYYEDDLLEIFNSKYKFLWELHHRTHAFLMEALHEDIPFSETEQYIKNPNKEKKDIRFWLEPKTELDITFPPYTQIFDEKFGFIPNLSVLDLLFMEGNTARIYLKQMDLKLKN